MKLVVASNNKHKLFEIRKVLGDRIELVSLNDLGFNEEIPETSDTLQGNAFQKARFIHDRFKVNCIADDTGLEVEALDGAPGVYSARYAGENCSFDDNNRKLLKELDNKENRNARFRTVIALILDGKEYAFEGEVKGVILKEKHGKEGFGYDPIFRPDGFNESFAEMPVELKNKISHRGKALTLLAAFLNKHSSD